MSRALRTRTDWEQEERERLAPWAVRSADSRGRIVPEPEHPYRTVFQRDRDRIVHARAFRRLEYKTQVFVHHEGDHYRNRLTHTLEGAQIARTIARALRLNEDLAEAVTLAHDLGHTPFGHAGERVLDELLRGAGGFDHNRQTLRVVDWLEQRAPGVRGLNLSFETREGILKHGCRWEHPVPVPELGAQPSLEAQVADRSDEIAYVNHDLDDGLRSGLLSLAQLEEVPLWREVHAEVRARLPATRRSASDHETPVLRRQTIVALINRLVTDLVESSARRLEAAALPDVGALRRHAPLDPPGSERGERLFGYERALEKALRELKDFLGRNLYHHPHVVATTRAAEQVLAELWRAVRADPGKLPESVRARFAEDGEERAIADYLAGMTDRFALAEHRRLVEPDGPVG
ncbi:MAG: deoxyguanosinetriphosphate triphosphohydrolase [Deltaproteobacteria bacterium]|nr:deoxyguanosinetriphosphate triphosphohydrolase [Deltaproteobacteria bacterium]